MFSFVHKHVELADAVNKFFSSSSSTTKNHLVCVNYVPVTTFSGNSKVYSMLSKQGNSSLILSLKKSYSSRPEDPGFFRSKILGLDALQSTIIDIRSQMSAGHLGDRGITLTDMLETVSQALEDLLEITDSLAALSTEFSDLKAGIETVFSEMSKSSISDTTALLQRYLNDLLSWITKIRGIPEGIIDLFAFVEKSFSSPPSVISFIEELSAINILTEDFRNLQDDMTSVGAAARLTKERIAYDQHMLHANYELLSVFVSKLSRDRYDVPMQETYRRLKEYVPIAMKFWHIYNPLLDSHPVFHRRIWDTLAEKFNIIKTAEVVTNLCGANGHKMDVEDVTYSSSDVTTEYIGHIYYGMCSDFNSIFKDERTVPEVNQLLVYRVSPKQERWMPNTIVYTPFLAEAVVLKMLETAKTLDEYQGKETYYIADNADAGCKLLFHAEDTVTVSPDFLRKNEEFVADAGTVVLEKPDEKTNVFAAADNTTLEACTASSVTDDSAARILAYYVNSNDAKFLFAVQEVMTGRVISIRDILRNPATANYVCALTEQSVELFGIFEMVSNAPVCHILLPLQFSKTENISILEASHLQEHVDPDVWYRVKADYAGMCEGIQVFVSRELVTLPVVDCCSLSYIKFAGGDSQAYDKYISMYNACNPHLGNNLQPLPTAPLSLAIPKYEDICAAYNETVADDVEDDSEEVVQAVIQSYADLDIGISTEYIPITKDYAGTLDFHDCLFYKQAAAIVKPNEVERYIALIEGDASNNDLAIADTELAVFLALRNLVIYDLCMERNLFTLEEINKDLSVGACGKIMTKFMKDMLNQAYSLNWSHTGDVFEITEDSEVDPEEETTESLYNCYYHVREIPREGGGTTFEKVVDPSEANIETLMGKYQSRVSGLLLLDQQITKNVINPFGYIDAIIRLLRWGELKPSFIYIPSYTLVNGRLSEKPVREYVNLTDRNISEFSGVWKDTDRTVYSDGAYYLVDGAISMTVEHGYSSALFSEDIASGTVLLCGIPLRSNYGSSAVSQVDFVDIFTLATGIADGIIKIHGITYDGATKNFSANETTDMSLQDYSAERYFRNLKVDVFSAVANSHVVGDEQRSVVYQSTNLMMNYRMISHLFTRMDNRAYPSVFDILRDSTMDINPDAVRSCAAAITTDIKNIQSIMRKFALDEKAYVEYAFMQSVVNRFIAFNKLYEKTDGSLTEALPIYDSVTGMPLNSYAESAANSSAETIDTSPSIIHESAAQE